MTGWSGFLGVEVTELGAPLPPAMDAAHRLLGELGPLSAADVRNRLRSEGFSPSIERLAQLPDRFPTRFQLTDDGLLAIAAHGDTDPTQGEHPADERPDWYRVTRLP